MSDRRSLLDPLIYKISEEDSQDEEVVLSRIPSLYYSTPYSTNSSRFSLPESREAESLVKKSKGLESGESVSKCRDEVKGQVHWPISRSGTDSKSSEAEESHSSFTSSDGGEDSLDESSGQSSCSSCSSKGLCSYLPKRRLSKPRVWSYPRRTVPFLALSEIESLMDTEGNFEFIDLCPNEESSLGTPSLDNIVPQNQEHDARSRKEERGRNDVWWDSGDIFTGEGEEISERVELLLKWEGPRVKGRRVTLLESLLGILPIGPGLPSSSSSDRIGRILIGGLVEDGPGGKSGRLQTGDWIHTINGIVVNLTNIDFVLGAIEQRHSAAGDIKISIGVKRGNSRINSIEKVKESISSVQVPTRKCEKELGVNLRERCSVFLYLPPERGSSSEGGVYSWPPEEKRSDGANRMIRKLSEAHGFFLTLHSLATGDCPHSTQSQLREGNEKWEVVTWSDNGGDSLLLLLHPIHQSTHKNSTSSEEQLQLIAQLLLFNYGSLPRAFGSNREKLERMLDNIVENSIESTLFSQQAEPIRLTSAKNGAIENLLLEFLVKPNFEEDFQRVEIKERLMCADVALLSRGEFLYSTMADSMKKTTSNWLFGQLGSGGVTTCRRLVIWQRVFIRTDSPVFLLLLAIEEFMLLTILQPLQPRIFSIPCRDILEWVEHGKETLCACVQHLETKINGEEILEDSVIFEEPKEPFQKKSKLKAAIRNVFKTRRAGDMSGTQKQEIRNSWGKLEDAWSVPRRREYSKSLIPSGYQTMGSVDSIQSGEEGPRSDEESILCVIRVEDGVAIRPQCESIRKEKQVWTQFQHHLFTTHRILEGSRLGRLSLRPHSTVREHGTSFYAHVEGSDQTGDGLVFWVWGELDSLGRKTFVLLRGLKEEVLQKALVFTKSQF